MVNVVRILVTKLIKQNSLESAVTYSKAVKAAFFLFNLLGITYILFFLSPGDGAGEIAFFYVNAIFQSFQVNLLISSIVRSELSFISGMQLAALTTCLTIAICT